jgi:hypothetical protein
MCAWFALLFLGGDITEEECNEWLRTRAKITWSDTCAQEVYGDFRVTRDDLETQRRLMETDGRKLLTKVDLQHYAAHNLIRSPSGRKAVREAMSQTTRENLLELLGLK